MATDNVKKVAIAWYRREDYPVILDLMEDGTTFPATYDDWLKRAQHVLLCEESSGSDVLQVTIDPGSFSAWCARTVQKPDSLARALQLAIALGGYTPNVGDHRLLCSRAPLALTLSQALDRPATWRAHRNE